MKNLKYFILLLLGATHFSASAQSIIYKCYDTEGNVIYSNDKSSNRCEKTNLATVDKRSILNKPVSSKMETSNNSPLVSSNIDTQIQNSEQSLRDKKRAIILQGELTEEKNQLKVILEMLSKASKSDTAQITQLKNMEQAHRRNIASLEKELGGNNASTKTKPSSSPANLPFSLPKEAADVELVETPKIPHKALTSTNKTSPKQSEVKTTIPANPTFVPPPVIRQSMVQPLITNKSIKKKIILPQKQ